MCDACKRLTVLLHDGPRTASCTADFPNRACYQALMEADLRISVKDYRRKKTLKIQLLRVPFSCSRQFWVRMNGAPWPNDRRPGSLTRLLIALRKSLVMAV